MAALPTALQELAEQAAFRIYVTDALYCTGSNRHMSQRYADIINEWRKPRETRSAQEIVDDVVTRCGITIEG